MAYAARRMDNTHLEKSIERKRPKPVRVYRANLVQSAADLGKNCENPHLSTRSHYRTVSCKRWKSPLLASFVLSQQWHLMPGAYPGSGKLVLGVPVGPSTVLEVRSSTSVTPLKRVAQWPGPRYSARHPSPMLTLT